MVACVVAEIPNADKQKARQRAALHDLFTGPKLGFDGAYAGHYAASCAVVVTSNGAGRGITSVVLRDEQMVHIMAPEMCCEEAGLATGFFLPAIWQLDELTANPRFCRSTKNERILLIAASA